MVDPEESNTGRDTARPSPPTPDVGARMSRQRRRDTAPEMALRSELHRRGLRFRVDHPLPGLPRRRADLVLARARIAVFVDGCFWHGCPEHATRPVSNEEWWAAKLARNTERDRETDAHLRDVGWLVIRVWEHESPVTAADMVQKAWIMRRDGTGGGPSSCPTG